jgi:hypothetical protein
MRKTSDELRTEWADKWIAAMILEGEDRENLEKALIEDPFMVQLYALAGATLD